MQTTRERILTILKERRRATVEDLSRELGLTAVTVRHHLGVLRGEDLIAEPEVRHRRTPGRPQYVYSLTSRANAVFPKKYDHLASLLLSEVRACLPPEEIKQVLQRIGERIADQALIPREGDFEARLVSAVAFMNEQGYMARWERDEDDSYLIHVANCPYENVVRHDGAVCTIGTTLLTRLLGESSQHMSHAAEDGETCMYRFRSENSSAPAGRDHK